MKITICVFIAALVLLFILYIKRRKNIQTKGGQDKAVMSEYGLNIYDEKGNVIFSDGDKVFRYVGYRDLTFGSFTISIPINGGEKAIFLVTRIPISNEGYWHRDHPKMDVPFIKGGKINGGVFSGNVDTPAFMVYENNKDVANRKKLLRVYYGVVNE